MADAQDLLDQQVDGFGGPVADPAGVKVGQEFSPPGGDGAGQPTQLRHVGVDACHGPVVEAGGGLVAVAAAIDCAQFLGGDPGGGDLAVMVAGLDADQKARPAGGGEVLGAAAQHPADPVERIVAAAAMPVGVLLDAAAYVVDGGEPQPYDVEGIQDPHGVRQAGRQGGAVAAERIQGGHVDAGSPFGGLVNQPVGQHFPASPGDDVDELPAVQVDDADGEHCRALGWARRNAVSSTPTAATCSMRSGCSINGVP